MWHHSPVDSRLSAVSTLRTSHLTFKDFHWFVISGGVMPCWSPGFGTNKKGCGKPVLITGAWGLSVLHMFLSFSVVSLFVGWQPFQTKPKSPCNWQSFQFSVKISSQSIHCGEKKIIQWRQNPLSAALHGLHELNLYQYTNDAHGTKTSQK